MQAKCSIVVVAEGTREYVCMRKGEMIMMRQNSLAERHQLQNGKWHAARGEFGSKVLNGMDEW